MNIACLILLGVVVAFASGCAISHDAIEPGRKVPAHKEPSHKDAEPEWVAVKSINGVWWFEHKQRKFLSLGVNAVIAREVDHSRGGRPYPLAYDGVAAHGGNREAWKREALDRLKNWGMNTLGAWSDDDLEGDFPLYITRAAWLGGYRANPDMRLIDVWSAVYASAIDRQAREQILPWASNTSVIGFFLNNELPWFGREPWPSDLNDSLLARYMELDGIKPGKRQLIAFLERFYSNQWEQFAADWHVPHLSDFNALRNERTLRPRRHTHRHAVEAWAGEVAEQYFRVTSAALNKYAPNHLNLGVRFAGKTYASVIRAAASYVDVISFNDYDPKGVFDTEYFDALYEMTGRPLLITETSWRARENRSGCPNSRGANVTVDTQAERALYFNRYTSAALSRPYIVGYHWFCWADQPPGGRFDGEDSNYGIVDIYNAPYKELVAAMNRVNASALLMHSRGERAQLNPNARLLEFYPRPKLPDGPPAESPVCMDVNTPDVVTWWDPQYKPYIHVKGTPSGLQFRMEGLKGWGGGFTIPSPQEALSHPDKIFSIRGCRMLTLTIAAQPGTRFRVILNESGAGPTGLPEYKGVGAAEGESFISDEITLQQAEETITLYLQEFALNDSYGNSRGRGWMDLEYMKALDLYFPAGQNIKGVVKSACFHAAPGLAEGARP